MSNLIVTGVVDGPLSGGLPKALEIYVLEDVADLSVYSLGTAFNGNATIGSSFTFPATAAAKGEFIYVASETAGFQTFFGFAPDYTSSVLNVNGDDTIQLLMGGVVVDAIGQIGVDGTGTAWEYLDGWAKRVDGTAPNPVFDAAEWIFSGPDSFDDDAGKTNATATDGFPIASYTPAEPQKLLINAVLGSTVGTDSEYVELIGAPGTALAGYSLIVVESDASAGSVVNGTIDLRVDFGAGDVIGSNGFFLLANGTAAATYGVTPDHLLDENAIENSSYTLALVETASLGAVGSVVTGLEVVQDAVGVTNGVAGAVFHFDAPVVGPDGGFMPAGVVRITDGVDTDTATDFALLNFNNDTSVNTPRAGGASEPQEPGDTYTAVKIHQIQGSTNLANGTVVGTAGAADASPMEGQAVRVQAIVTQLMWNGFYIQEEDTDADDDAYSSEGIFIFSNATVRVGDLVTVDGIVDEYFGETQIGAASVTVDSSDNPLPAATVIEFPTATVLVDADGDYVANLEAYEGMRVTIPQEMTITEMFNLDRFGTIRLSSDGQLETYTQSNAPSVEGYDLARQSDAARSLVIDDGSSQQNPAVIKVPFLGTDGTLDAGDVVRMGDSYTGLTGVLSYSEDYAAASEEPEYRLHTPAEGTLIQNNPRPEAPADVGGSLKVTAFNVLNYFTTLSGGTGPDGSLSPRGANNQTEFERQEAKLVAAINAVAADVVGLVEIENDPMGSTSLLALVSALNAAGGTYAYLDTGAIQGAMGGAAEGDAIKVGFLYNYETIALNGSFALLDETVDVRFQTVDTQRASIAQTFTEIASGESFTAVVNHLKSKSSAVDGDVDIMDGQGASANVRTAAAEALADWLASDPTGTGESDILILGDLNAYAMEDAITAIREGADDVMGTDDDYVDLGEIYEPGGYGYVFDGQTGTLDYALANISLAAQVTGATRWNINAPEADAFDYNLDFGRDPSLYTPDAYRSSDHDPVVVGLELGKNPIGPFVFTLEILHMSDQEGNGSSILYAPNASAVLAALEAQDLGNDGIADNTIRLSSGDAFIPGVFYDASAAVFGSGGIGDIQIQNELGFQAITLGNHEFDKGTKVLADLITGAATGNFDALVGSTLFGLDFTGTNMPYLSANLDFSTDPNLAPLATAGGQAPLANKVTSSTVLEENGELIGVVGATTPTLARISSTGTLEVGPAWAGTTPTEAEIDALAAILQAEVDALLAANPTMNKVILSTHMQVIDIELALAARMSHVDVIIAGGSNTRLSDEDDRLIDGDVSQGQYPLFIENANGGVTAVVNTDGNYKYVGRLVIDFDEDGNIIADSYDPAVSGIYATDDAGVAALDAEHLVDAEVKAIADAIEAQIIATQGNVFGVSEVFLNGNRTGTNAAGNPDGVRSQETNLGNITADANLSYAKKYDSSVLVSIKNGGGIRASIGEATVPAGSNEVVRGPNGALLDGAGNVIKPAGGISQADIASALAFNNTLSIVTVSRADLVAILEHAVAGAAGAGQFAQVSGIQFSFDATQPAGSRIVSAAIVDAEGNDLDVLMRGGALQGDGDATIRMVSLGFLVDGGDGYPFPTEGLDRIDLDDLDGDGIADGVRDGIATFSDNGTEQDAFAEYLAEHHATAETAYRGADTGYGDDARIQNLAYRADTVIDEPEFEFILGTAGRDNMVGTDADEIFVSGGGNFDQMTGGLGADVFYFGAEALDGLRHRDTITDYEVGVDAIALGVGVTVSSIKQAGNTLIVYLDDPNGADDAIYIHGAGGNADNLDFLYDFPLVGA